MGLTRGWEPWLQTERLQSDVTGNRGALGGKLACEKQSLRRDFPAQRDGGAKLGTTGALETD